MKYIDNDIKDFDDYIEFTTFNKFNIRILFTKQHYHYEFDVMKPLFYLVKKNLF